MICRAYSLLLPLYWLLVGVTPKVNKRGGGGGEMNTSQAGGLCHRFWVHRYITLAELAYSLFGTHSRCTLEPGLGQGHRKG